MKSFALTLALTTSALADAPRIIDDQKLVASIEKHIGAAAGTDGIPSADDLAKASKAAPRQLAPPAKLSENLTSSPDYERLSASVYLIAGVYQCGKCDRWHPSSTATAWCLTNDGLMVTNAHVFEKASGGAMGVCDRDGKCFPIIEVLASDSSADIAIFRVKGENLTPLPLGPDAKVGDDISILSHPDRRYFTHTSGEVSRYSVRPAGRKGRPSTWMSVTADYAKGSSGGPVLNASGAVVGMVSSTQSIYYESSDGTPKGPLQMVVKYTVPVSAIRTVLGLKDHP